MNGLKRTVYLLTGISVLVCIVSIIIYTQSGMDAVYSAAITFGTISYHFVMRLAVGLVIDKTMNNKADYNSKWFKCSKLEEKLYKRLNVKKWIKKGIPTFRPEYFDRSKHTWDEIAQAMCQAEIVHEVIVLLSFVPIAFSIPFGALPVFIITSIFAALFDLMFVIVQRYNRPRIIKLIR